MVRQSYIIKLGTCGISRFSFIIKHLPRHCLQIQPEQTEVSARINGILSYELATVSEMLAVYDAYA
jgi:hypothetical protein